MSQQKTITVLLLNVFITSLVHAQYGSPVGNSNPGYGGTGTGVPSNDYGHRNQNPSGPSGSDGNSEPEPFNFSYQVKDAPTYTDFKHEANSDGKRVTGAYSVLLPDGRNQIVTYTADENGYNAKVNYEGEAKPQPPQPGNPGGSGGYSSGVFPSSAPNYPSSASGFPSPAPNYPPSASGFPSPAPSYSTGFAQPSYSTKGSSYGAPQQKNGGY